MLDANDHRTGRFLIQHGKTLTALRRFDEAEAMFDKAEAHFMQGDAPTGARHSGGRRTHGLVPTGSRKRAALRAQRRKSA